MATFIPFLSSLLSDCYRAKLPKTVLSAVCSTPRVQQMVIKKTNEEWLVDLELHCVYLFQTFWTHNFLRRPLSECQWCLVSGDRMPETWRTSSRSRGKGVYQGGLSLVAGTYNALWLVNTVRAGSHDFDGGQWMLMKGVNTKDTTVTSVDHSLTVCQFYSDQCQWSETGKSVHVLW